MIAFKDEFLKFRDVNSRTVISFDLIFKKCPVCGRERQIYDPDEYLLKIRRPGKPTLYFDRESCLKNTGRCIRNLIKRRARAEARNILPAAVSKGRLLQRLT